MSDVAEFTECSSCAAKPGAPELCETCLERRGLYYEVESLHRDKQELQEIQQELLKRIEKASATILRYRAALADSGESIEPIEAILRTWLDEEVLEAWERDEDPRAVPTARKILRQLRVRAGDLR